MSESRLVPCVGCGRHIVGGDACPFCGQASEPPKGGYGAGPGAPPLAPVARPSGLDDEGLRVSAPRYGMPPLSPTHPAGVARWLVLLVVLAAPVLLLMRLLRR